MGMRVLFEGISFLHPDTHFSHMSHTSFPHISEYHSFFLVAPDEIPPPPERLPPCVAARGGGGGGAAAPSGASALNGALIGVCVALAALLVVGSVAKQDLLSSLRMVARRYGRVQVVDQRKNTSPSVQKPKV